MLNRRHFLRQSAAAGAVLTTVAAPVAAEPVQGEHPELLRIGAALPGAIAARAVAVAEREAARARFAALVPALPAELIAPASESQWLSEREVDCEGNDVWPEPVDGRHKAPRRIYSSDALIRAKRHPGLVPVAKAYEAAWEQAREASGIGPALETFEAATDDLVRLATGACKVAPASRVGLVIKARAIAACVACGGEPKGYVAFSALRLSDDVLAILDTGAGE